MLTARVERGTRVSIRMSARMSASSIASRGGGAESGIMHELLIAAGILVALVVLDLLANRFGVDSRQPPDAWW
jgi:hypothetical protein